VDGKVGHGVSFCLYLARAIGLRMMLSQKISDNK
jgi:hypothetical protein